MRALALVLLLGGVASAEDAKIPYRVWWSFPDDDDTAIEVDEPDLTNSKWDSERWKFAVAMLKCDTKKSKSSDPTVGIHR